MKSLILFLLVSANMVYAQDINFESGLKIEVNGKSVEPNFNPVPQIGASIDSGDNMGLFLAVGNILAGPDIFDDENLDITINGGIGLQTFEENFFMIFGPQFSQENGWSYITEFGFAFGREKSKFLKIDLGLTKGSKAGDQGVRTREISIRYSQTIFQGY